MRAWERSREYRGDGGELLWRRRTRDAPGREGKGREVAEGVGAVSECEKWGSEEGLLRGGRQGGARTFFASPTSPTKSNSRSVNFVLWPRPRLDVILTTMYPTRKK